MAETTARERQTGARPAVQHPIHSGRPTPSPGATPSLVSEYHGIIEQGDHWYHAPVLVLTFLQTAENIYEQALHYEQRFSKLLVTRIRLQLADTVGQGAPQLQALAKQARRDEVTLSKYLDSLNTDSAKLHSEFSLLCLDNAFGLRQDEGTPLKALRRKARLLLETIGELKARMRRALWGREEEDRVDWEPINGMV